MGGRGVYLALALGLSALASCYSPSVEPCIYACGKGDSCPSGLHCNGQNMCAASETAVCSGVPIDARTDGATDAMLDAPTDVPLDMFVDVTPPDTIIDTMPPLLDSSATATFTFHSTEAGGGFECMHDSGTFMPCTSPDTMTGLTNGAHSFQVRARDASGNVDQSPAKYMWTYDDNMPDTVIDTHPPSFANVNFGSFTFHCVKPTDTPECQLDSGAFAACTSATTYMFSGLFDAVHTFTVRCKSPLGMVDPSPASFMWTIDTQRPVTTVTTKPPMLTNDSTPTFAFSSEPGATFECQMDSGAFVACTSPYTFGNTIDGPHIVTIRATDAAGNTEASPPGYMFTIDTVPPTTTITSSPMSPTSSSIATFNFTSEVGATFECRIDGSSFNACSSPTSFNVGEGDHIFYVRAKDMAGNVEIPVSKMWTVDLTDPVVTFNAPTPAANSVTGPAVGIDWSVSEAVVSTTCTLDGVSIPGCAPSLDLSVPHGMNHTFIVTVKDAVGRMGTAQRVWSVDCRYMGTMAGPGTFGFFHFDEMSGDALVNGYPGGNNGFNGGMLGPDLGDAPRVNTGRYPGGRALQFTETGGEKATWPTGLAQKQGAFTFEIWVMPQPGGGPTFSTTHNVMSSTDGSAQLVTSLVGSTTVVSWIVKNGGGVSVALQGSLADNVWNHVLATFDQGTARMWVNGGQVAPQTLSGTVNVDMSTITWGSNGSEPFAGLLDEPYLSVLGFTTGDFHQHYCPLTF